MGSCLGHCRLSRETFGLYKFYSKARESVGIQINNLGKSDSEEHIIHDLSSLQDEYNTELDGSNPKQSKCTLDRLISVFSNTKAQYAENTTLRLELLDDEWSISEAEGDYAERLKEIVIPSSANMKESKDCTSASINSLDLEWEHLPEMAIFSKNLDKEEPKSATSAEAWSRISSADSLEWDPAEVVMKEEIDTETEQLIQQIEMLSSKTLQETQEWAS